MDIAVWSLGGQSGFLSSLVPLLPFLCSYANPYSVQLRYDVYANLNAPANYMALSNSGSGMTTMWSDYNSLTALIDMLNWCVDAHPVMPNHLSSPCSPSLLSASDVRADARPHLLFGLLPPPWGGTYAPDMNLYSSPPFQVLCPQRH